MATAERSGTRLDALTDRLDRFGLSWVRLGVAGIVALALALRFYRLGARTAHWDEARVAYWILHFAETGAFEYRPIIHGPFYHHVNAALFDLLGASDFSMRLVVAVAGGLFPLVALLLRHRLGDVETVALAAFLAVTPVLVYYSRFMRGDPLVAVFMVTAFALFVRTVDFGSKPAFLAGVGFVALGFTVKENAVLYLLSWAGASVLLLDHRLFLAGDRDRDPKAIFVTTVRRVAGALRRWLPALAVGAVEFLVIIVYFYAPRTGEAASPEGPGLDDALADPSLFPTVIDAATVGAWQDLWGTWIAGDHQDHSYLPYLGDFLQTMATGALAVSLLALFGFLVDRYSDDGPSDLPAFAFYWGFASVLGYPLATDIRAPWATIHAAVPLAITAAVGVGFLVRWGYRKEFAGDRLRAGVAALVLLLVVGQLAWATGMTVYVRSPSQDHELVQYAQPAGDINPITDKMAAVAAGNDSRPDVVFYGEYFVDGDTEAEREPACVKWFNALPLPWYVQQSGSDVACADSEEALATTVEESQPPIVVAREEAGKRVRLDLDEYEAYTYRLRAWGTETTFFVHESHTDDLRVAHGRADPSGQA